MAYTIPSHQQLSWQSVFWGLSALALNATANESGPLFGLDNLSPMLKLSPFHCAGDILYKILELVLFSSQSLLARFNRSSTWQTQESTASQRSEERPTPLPPVQRTAGDILYKILELALFSSQSLLARFKLSSTWHTQDSTASQPTEEQPTPPPPVQRTASSLQCDLNDSSPNRMLEVVVFVLSLTQALKLLASTNVPLTQTVAAVYLSHWILTKTLDSTVRSYKRDWNPRSVEGLDVFITPTMLGRSIYWASELAAIVCYMCVFSPYDSASYLWRTLTSQAFVIPMFTFFIYRAIRPVGSAAHFFVFGLLMQVGVVRLVDHFAEQTGLGKTGVWWPYLTGGLVLGLAVAGLAWGLLEMLFQRLWRKLHASLKLESSGDEILAACFTVLSPMVPPFVFYWQFYNAVGTGQPAWTTWLG